ncbi:hypothetical protein ACFL2Q_00205 [Thermodesulfobacteriota bacterium]
MTVRLMIILAFIAVPCFAADTDITTPSNAQIKKWWKPQKEWVPSDKMVVEKTARVILKGGEVAFLASVAFPRRGSNFLSGTVLIRPALKEAREIEKARRVLEIHDLDGDGISEVIAESFGSGTGTTSGEKTILSFDDWKPIVLYVQGYSDDLGACSKEVVGRPCHAKEVEWAFRDVDGDQILDLVEVIKLGEGEENDQLKWKKRTNVLLFKDKKFVPASPDPTPPNVAPQLR